MTLVVEPREVVQDQLGEILGSQGGTERQLQQLWRLIHIRYVIFALELILDSLRVAAACGTRELRTKNKRTKKRIGVFPEVCNTFDLVNPRTKDG